MSCHVMSPEVPMVRTQLLEDHPAHQPPPVRSGLPGAPDLRQRGEAWDHLNCDEVVLEMDSEGCCQYLVIMAQNI